MNIKEKNKILWWRIYFPAIVTVFLLLLLTSYMGDNICKTIALLIGPLFVILIFVVGLLKNNLLLKTTPNYILHRIIFISFSLFLIFDVYFIIKFIAK